MDAEEMVGLPSPPQIHEKAGWVESYHFPSDPSDSPSSRVYAYVYTG